MVKESDTAAVESAVGTTGSEDEWDESETSSDKPAGTRESETVCAESQPRSNKPEQGMTAGDKSGAGVVGSKVTCVDSQSG